MSGHENARTAAHSDFLAQWANSLGRCALCPTAAAGGCDKINRRAVDAGISEEDTRTTLGTLQEAQARKVELG